jgi:hypothetical protein
MFIKTEEMSFPFESQFEILFPLSEEEIDITVLLKRLAMEPDSNDGIAVELLKPSREYLEFVSNLKSKC